MNRKWVAVAPASMVVAGIPIVKISPKCEDLKKHPSTAVPLQPA
jgi:hypothetical protein